MSIISHFNNLTKSKFVKNVIIVASGTAGAQIITIAFSPMITRLYGPDTYGTLGMFLAVVAVVTPISGMSYPIAIVLPKRNSEAEAICRLSIYISVIVASSCLIILILFKEQIAEIFNIQEVEPFLLLLPLIILFKTWLQVKQQWLIRIKKFKKTASVTTIQSLVVNIIKVFFGFLKPVAGVLISISIFSDALQAAMLTHVHKKPKKSEINHHISLVDLAKKYSDFPCFRFPQTLINTISQNLPIVVLAAFFGPAEAGFFTLCRKILSLPVRLIGQSVSDVFYPKITEAFNNSENFTSIIIRATISLALIGIVPILIVIMFGPMLFKICFGREWLISGEYARWLAIFVFFQLINRPSVAAIPILGLQKGLMVYETFSTSLKIVALYVSYFIFKNDIVTIASFSIIGTVCYIVLILWVIKSSKKISSKKVGSIAKNSRR